ncbi:unnamed protein product [Cunninghamella echinulata]
MFYNKLIFIYCIFVFISIIYAIPRPTATTAITKDQMMKLSLTKRACGNGETFCTDDLCCAAGLDCKHGENGHHFCAVYRTN